MHHRSARLAVLLLAFVVTGVVVWRITTNEQSRGRARQAAQQVDAKAADTILALADLRGALHAMVAQGHSEAAWSARARDLTESIRSHLAEIEPAAAGARHSVLGTTDSVNRLAALQDKVLAHVTAGQMLLAGDLVFEEARTRIDAMTSEIAGARQALARAASSREAGMANEQSLLAGALMAVWTVALILLVPLPSQPGAAPIAVHDAPAAMATSTAEPLSEMALRPVGLVATPAVTVGPAPELQSLADLCRDLGRIADAADLAPLLARASGLMAARGLVVWLQDAESPALVPALAHGYDATLLARVGPLDINADNLTAEAFRSGVTATTPATMEHAGAVAVPIVSAGGPLGVLAAEIVAPADPLQAAAIGGVVAAQLSGLFPAPAAKDPAARQAHA